MVLYIYSDFFVFFFFQAEDGIRDGTVTGVQTCALPIFGRQWNCEPSPIGRRASACLRYRAWPRWTFLVAKCASCKSSSRSEERRVGKECRSRGSPYH